MLSMKARFFRFLLKNRHWFKGKLHSEIINQDTDLRLLREEVRKGASRGRIPKNVHIVTEEQAPQKGEWHIPEAAPEDKMVLYFHGSGFVMGSARDHRPIVANLSARCGFRTLVFDYSLAPENPFPKAVIEAESLYRWLLEKGWQPGNIVVAGDSAGACIALGTLLKLKDSQTPMPRAVVAVSPCTDLTRSGQSHQVNLNRDPITPKGANDTYMKWYIGDSDPTNPYASPLFGNLSGLPPMQIHVGSLETLLDDSVRLAEKVKAAGGSADLFIAEGMFHCYPLLAPLFPEATKGMDEICRFIQKQLS